MDIKFSLKLNIWLFHYLLYLMLRNDAVVNGLVNFGFILIFYVFWKAFIYFLFNVTKCVISDYALRVSVYFYKFFCYLFKSKSACINVVFVSHLNSLLCVQDNLEYFFFNKRCVKWHSELLRLLSRF